MYIVSKCGMGHSCWAIAGTFCFGTIQGATTQNIKFCTYCEVYELYNRSRGELRKMTKATYPEEEAKYYNLMLRRYDDNSLARVI